MSMPISLSPIGFTIFRAISNLAKKSTVENMRLPTWVIFPPPESGGNVCILINVSLAQFGFALSLAVCVGAAGVLQNVFSEQLNRGEKLMLLPFAPVVWIFFACAPLAVMASFLASRRILKSDLSESLREGAG